MQSKTILDENLIYNACTYTKKPKTSFLYFLVFPISIIFMELVLKICTAERFFDIGLLFMPLYSIAIGTCFSAFCTCFSKTANRVFTLIFLGVLSLVFSTQIVYHYCFGNYLILYSIGVGGADQVIQEGLLETTLLTIKACALPVIITFIPFILSIIFVGKGALIIYPVRWFTKIINFIFSFALYFSVYVLAFFVPTTNEVFLQSFDPNLTVDYFGLLNTEFKDFRYNVLGLESQNTIKVIASSNSTKKSTTKKLLLTLKLTQET